MPGSVSRVFLSFLFFDVDHLKNLYWVYYNIVSVLFFFGLKACGFLAPCPGIGPIAPCIGRWSPNHWTARDVPQEFFYIGSFDSQATPWGNGMIVPNLQMFKPRHRQGKWLEKNHTVSNTLNWDLNQGHLAFNNCTVFLIWNSLYYSDHGAPGSWLLCLSALRECSTL